MVNSEKKVRNSNIEILRIIAMFLVLLVHADYLSLGEVSFRDFTNNPLDASLRVLFEVITIVCVDTFVMISGWFGISPSLKGFCNFIFQILFFFVGAYVVSCILGLSSISVHGLLNCIVAGQSGWFIKAYMFLYLLAPVLNSFIENASRSTYRNVLVSYFSLLIIYGWLFPGATRYLAEGYSPMLFIGLYLLARYLNLYRPKITQFTFKQDLLSIAGVMTGVFILFITPPILLKIDTLPYMNNRFFSYIAPTNILIASLSVIAFSKLKIQSRVINWVAASSFAAYLLHANQCVNFRYVAFFKSLHAETEPLTYWGITLLLLVIFFLVAVLIDQLRIFLWKMTRKK